MEEEPQGDQSATIRINGSMFKDHISSIVRVVGRVGQQIDGAERKELSLVTSDDSVVQVLLTTDTVFNEDDVIEVIGTVRNENSIEEVLIVPFNKQFGLSFVLEFPMIQIILPLSLIDMASYDQALRLMHGPFKHLFQ